MKKIRIGNDIRFRWQIRRGDSAESFEGKDISVVLRDQFGRQYDIEWHVSEDGVISGVSRGKTQNKLGVYTLTLVENDGANDMATVDKISAWRLVSTQDASLVDDTSIDDCGNINVEVVELSSEIGLGSVAMSVDSELDEDSPNAVANSAVTKGINTKADKNYVDTELAAKANVNVMTDILATKADKTELDKKADNSEVSAELATKTTLDEVKTKVQGGEWLALQNGSGENSLVGGNNCSATGQYAFASGLQTQASGLYSHAEGVFSIASGNYSHAEGSNAKPKGERAEVASQGGHAEGVCTYLNDNEDVIHHVGVGYYNDKLSTDVILRKYGDAKNGYQYMIGIGGYNGKDITDSTRSLQEVVADYGQRITSTESSLTTLNDSVATLTSNISDQSTKIDNINDRFASYVPTSAKGTANGIATLDGKGQVPVSQLGNVDTELFLIVAELPTEDIKTNKVYLVPSGTTEQGNVYAEWVYVNNAWEKFGEYKPEVDLTAYSTTEEIKTNVQNGVWLSMKQGKANYSLIIGNPINKTASGEGSCAIGYYTHTQGKAAFAEGYGTQAGHDYSHTEGCYTDSVGIFSHVEGVRNYFVNSAISCIGVGVGVNSSIGEPLNARVVIWDYGQPNNGYIYILGIGGYGGQAINNAKSLQQVIADHASNISALTATRMDVITTGGSDSEPVPVWTDSTRHDITQKKRTQTFTGFTDIVTSNDIEANTDAAAKLRDRRSWISSMKIRNFSGTKLLRAFAYCGGIRHLDTSTWDMSRVTTMRSTFFGCVQLEELDTSHWDVHSLTDLGYTFYNCKKIRSFDVRGWDTSNVTSMDGTFNTCSALTELDLAGWVTTQVQTVNSMFNGCGSLRRLDIRYWDLSQCTSMEWFLSGCGAIEELYVGEGFGKVLNAVGTIDLSALTKWTGDSVQTLLTLYNRAADSSRNAITLRLSSQTKAALGTSGIQTLTSRGYTIA